MTSELSDTETLLFRTINEFVQELNFVSKSTHYNLQLYSRLLEKTPLTNINIVKKHNSCFASFYTSNKDAILNKNENNISSIMRYSEKVFIDIKNIISKLDKEQKNTVWDYLLTLSAIIDPNGGAKDVLKNKNKNQSFIEDIMGEVEGNINLTENVDPMSAVMGLMTSGIFGKLVGNLNSGMEDGSLDPKQMINSLQGMLGSLSSQLDNNKSSEKSTVHLIE